LQGDPGGPTCRSWNEQSCRYPPRPFVVRVEPTIHPNQKRSPMPKFMTIVKGSEQHAPPPPALFEAIDKLMKDAGKRLVGVGGWLSSDRGARARLAKGRVTVIDGPFTEAKEVIGGFAIYDVPSLDEAK